MDAATPIAVTRLRSGHLPETVRDVVATEEPLEIRVEGRSIAVTMRTPGHDEDLAAGFLLTEGVIKRAEELFEISVCPSSSKGTGNVADVLLAGVSVDFSTLTRHVFASSSCGLCGKATLDAIFQSFTPVQATWSIAAEVLLSLPDKLRAAQPTFEQTGGLHACGLFDLNGNLLALREDVGRHNALDKLLGYALRDRLLPLDRCLLLVSGRVSFELMQKALAGGIPLVAAISAPSSLAVQFAEASGQTLVGFLRGDRMNVYAGTQRILSA
ncbi:MAG: formate dehydrogenase accessory sulfurtransferase FdhD [Roseimicrobium sp.]